MSEGDITWYRYERHCGFEQEVGPNDMDLPGHHSHYSFLKRIDATMSITKHELLDMAKEAVADRGLNYGSPEENFDRIARRWRAHLMNRFGVEVPIDAASVAIMCDDMKTARLENDITHLDSWVDKAGYAACGANVAVK